MNSSFVMKLSPSLSRARRWMSLSVVAWALLAAPWGGWRACASCLSGGALSLLNFWWLMRGAHAVFEASALASGPDSGPPPAPGASWAITRFLLRYPPLFLAGYAIVSCSFVRREAFLLGLLSPVPGLILAAARECLRAERM